MALFRPEFVAEGATALRILALGTALGTVLAMAPTYLKQRGQHRRVFQAVAIAALLQVALLAALVPPLGATGAAVAHVVASGAMYGIMAVRAHRGLRQSTRGR
ncbi:polysaccharide biosynthesis protein [Pseudoxanthomonas sp. 10H]|uniref:polysaccharide biosynthesis C-terminal domain-containing protein n=1 Tax=Pseudoxanthomonas sp. 10H TaxID=3242729 RepID=UPI00355687EB